MRRHRTHVRSAGRALLLGLLLFAPAPAGVATPSRPITPATPAPAAKEKEMPPTASGPLRVSTRNPRYFEDAQGRLVYLTGAHIDNLVDFGPTDPPAPFDFEAYLDLLQRHNHNFIRLWAWANSVSTDGNTVVYARPLPYLRTGPGLALDGKPKFDLTKFDPEYFSRLRARVIAAGRRGMYVSIMLFEGWHLQYQPKPWSWDGHPYHPQNNINGLNPDPDHTGLGKRVNTLDFPEVVALQDGYVRKVVDTVNDLDNVLYEIANEAGAHTVPWQYHMIRLLHDYEKTKPKQHPVGMSELATWAPQGENHYLFESEAEWVAPGYMGTDAAYYSDDAPGADGRKVVIPDTDHLQPVANDPERVCDRLQLLWKCTCRGMNFLYMDTDDLTETREPDRINKRRNAGYARWYVGRMDLAHALPRNALSSSKYCLSDGRTQFLVFLPAGGKVTVDLSGASGLLNQEWFDTTECRVRPAGQVAGGGSVEFTAPFAGPAVLYLWR